MGYPSFTTYQIYVDGTSTETLKLNPKFGLEGLARTLDKPQVKYVKNTFTVIIGTYTISPENT
jgi:hypothetical protein